MSVEIRLVKNGAQTFVLGDVETMTISPILFDAGALEFTYPADGLNFEQIRPLDEFELAVYLDGERQPKLDALIVDIDGDETKRDAVWKFSGYFNNGRLSEAKVYPAGWPAVPDPKNVKQVFPNSSAGSIMGILMAQAHTRGTLQDITANSFSNTTDSNGVAWTMQTSIEYAPGVDYLTIVQNLTAQGMCEFEVVGKDLRLYVPGTLGVDRVNVAFERGRDLADSPTKRTTRDLGTALLAAGTEGLYREATNPTEIARRRRVEAFSSQGSIGDPGTLQAYVQNQVALTSVATMEKTHGLVFSDQRTPRPMRQFDVADWVRSNKDDGYEKLRVKQWVLKLAADGTLSGSVTLNDLIAERELVLARRINGIIGGSTITGESVATPVVPDDLEDGVPPAAPTGLQITSLAYQDTVTGVTQAQATASWLAVTRNTDGSGTTDLAGYQVRWQYGTTSVNDPNGWQLLSGGTESYLSWSNLRTITAIVVQVRAFDRSGNEGPWSDAKSIVTNGDDVPPPKPSTPKVSNYLGQLRIEWDGKDSGGAVMPADLKYLEVHVSNTNNFTPDSTTRQTTLAVPGVAFLDSPYGVTRYVRFIAEDNTGNRSPASDVGSGSTAGVANQDLINQAIDAAKIADGAITNTKLGLGAVTGIKIADFAVDTQQIKDAAIKGGKVDALAIGTGHIALGAIDTAQIKDAAIQTAKIKDLAVSTAKIDNLAIGTAKIADAAISNAKIANLAVATANVQDAAINNAKIANMEVGKLTAGTLNAQVLLGNRITTSVDGARVELNAQGLMAYGTDGIRTVFIDDLTGNFDSTGTYRSALNSNGRSVIMAASLNAATGRGNAQPGIVFPTIDTSHVRYGQIYDDGRAVVIDSPTIPNTTGPMGFTRNGASLAVNAEGVFVYTEGQTADLNTDAFRVTNDGGVRAGRVDIFGRGTILLVQDRFTLETAGTGGTTVAGSSAGSWSMGDKNTTSYAYVSGNKTAWRLGAQPSYVNGNPDGTWYLGHPVDQAVYATGTAVVLRGRRAGGEISLAHVGGSAVNVYGDAANNNNAVLNVYGTINAQAKNFRIPHPVDDDKDLVHSVTESPTAGVEYWGEATLGEDGTVVVELPRYFEALTLRKGRAVLLTARTKNDGVLSSTYPRNGEFHVKGAANQRFFWLVKASRSDVHFEVEPARMANTNARPTHLEES